MGEGRGPYHYADEPWPAREFQILDPETGTVIDRRSEPLSRGVMAAGNDRAAIVSVKSMGDLIFQTVGCALTGRDE